MRYRYYYVSLCYMSRCTVVIFKFVAKTLSCEYQTQKKDVSGMVTYCKTWAKRKPMTG